MRLIHSFQGQDVRMFCCMLCRIQWSRESLKLPQSFPAYDKLCHHAAVRQEPHTPSFSLFYIKKYEQGFENPFIAPTAACISVTSQCLARRQLSVAVSPKPGAALEPCWWRTAPCARSLGAGLSLHQLFPSCGGAWDASPPPPAGAATKVTL